MVYKSDRDKTLTIICNRLFKVTALILILALSDCEIKAFGPDNANTCSPGVVVQNFTDELTGIADPASDIITAAGIETDVTAQDWCQTQCIETIFGQHNSNYVDSSFCCGYFRFDDSAAGSTTWFCTLNENGQGNNPPSGSWPTFNATFEINTSCSSSNYIYSYQTPYPYHMNRTVRTIPSDPHEINYCQMPGATCYHEMKEDEDYVIGSPLSLLWGFSHKNYCVNVQTVEFCILRY